MPRTVIKFDSGLPEIKIIGIASHENDYRLSWIINNEFGLNLKSAENLEIEDAKKGGLKSFPVFFCEEEEGEIQYRLISNKGEKGKVLLNEYKTLDYILHIQSEHEIENLPEKLRVLKKNGGITATYEIEWKALKAKKNLVFFKKQKEG